MFQKQCPKALKNTKKRKKQKTVYDSRVMFFLMNILARVGCRLFGWKVNGEKPAAKKYVVLMGTHGSNWDFIAMMASIFIYRQPMYWVGKESLFTSSLGFFFRWCGGLSVGDLKKNGTVESCVALFNESDECIIGIAPKGTRKAGAEWKTGFYHIAKNAGVPIVFSIIDTKKRTSGVYGLYTLTDDMEKDMAYIKSIYASYENA